MKVLKVLDHGTVDLVDFMGGDHRVDQAAGVSLAKFERYRKEEDIERIIRFMMRHRHGTPFEHSVFTFRIKAPIFVAREWMRHRIGSFNEVSGRYAELPNEHYNIKSLRGTHPTNRQSSVLLAGDPDELDAVRASIRRFQEGAFDLYRRLLDRGVAREVARGVLPLNTYTEYVWTVNARSLMNFLSLRMDETAQWEIQQYAHALMEYFKDKMPITAGAFVDNGHVAP